MSRYVVRAESKKCIVAAGSHGKTTTTSLIGVKMLDPTIVNGGIINFYQKIISLSKVDGWCRGR